MFWAMPRYFCSSNVGKNGPATMSSAPNTAAAIAMAIADPRDSGVAKPLTERSVAEPPGLCSDPGSVDTKTPEGTIDHELFRSIQVPTGSLDVRGPFGHDER